MSSLNDLNTGRLRLADYASYLSRYLGPQAGLTLAMTLSILAAGALALAGPQVVRYFLDSAMAGVEVRLLLSAAALYILFALFQRILHLLAAYLGKRVALAATGRLTADLALHCYRMDLSFHKRNTPGGLIERIDGDATVLGNFFSQFAVKLAGNGLLVLGILILFFRENVWVGAGMLVYALVTLVVLGSIQRLGEERWEQERQAAAEMSGYIEERIGGAEEIRACGAETYALNRLYLHLREVLRKTRAAFVVSSLTENLTNLVYVLGYSSGLALGVVLYLRGEVTLGTAYLILNYVGMLSEPLGQLREQAADFQHAAAGLRRIDALFRLRTAHSLAVLPDRRPGALPDGPLAVSLGGVTFRYEDGDDILRDIHLELAPGRVLGVLGRTGSGKSTLTRLLFRLYAPTAGEIRLGGLDSRQVDLSDWRARIGLVSQEVQIFQASLRENLTLFDPRITDERLCAALNAMGLWEWVADLPQGLDTPIQSGGRGISAGEAQLLAFTRVFLKDPGLVVLDEASSRLDPATEARMEHALDRLFNGRTGLIIAHRLKTVRRADDILILEDGRVAEFGPRRELENDPGSRFAALLRTGLEEVLA